MVVAPGRMIDSCLSIPDAESLPLYRMVLKLACVCAIYDAILSSFKLIYDLNNAGIRTESTDPIIGKDIVMDGGTHTHTS